MAKYYHRNHIVGQKGVNLLERQVLDMGSVWNPTNLEAGIDGHIELADPATGEALNHFLPVQVKSTEGTFLNETDNSFEFRCDERDLEYWLRGNARVVLVVVRPPTDEIYWTSIRDQFDAPERRAERRARFDKEADRLDGNSFARLLDLASTTAAGGIYLSPAPQDETLYSNLLPIVRMPSLIYVAETEFKNRRELWHVVDDDEALGNAWTIRESKIYSFRDLDSPEWKNLCGGAVEGIGTEHWTQSTDPDRRRELVELLNLTLTGILDPLGIRWQRKERLHYFLPAQGRHPDRVHSYRSFQNQAKSHVVKSRKRRDGKRGFGWVRHAALKSSFLCIEGGWHLELNPTFFFTTDGWRGHPRGGDLTSGKKEHEHNSSVVGQTLMWARLLGGDGSDPKLSLGEDPLLGFGDLVTFKLGVGIDDAQWLSRGGITSRRTEVDTGQSGIFDDE